MSARTIAFDRWPIGRRLMATTADALKGRAGLAFDRGSVRTFDRDGRMHVEVANISKACVNPYVGHEIPEWKALGLDGDKIYKLLRDPAELEKAAPTANNIPVMLEHVAVTADDHQPELVVGSTGTGAIFQAPFLRNGLVLWARDGIDVVESEEQKELSCAYHYRADMTPGTYEGDSYDGVMRDIEFNHVALVREGRAGADVVVGDSMEAILMATKSKLMSRTACISLGALAAFLSPKLAKDAKLDITPAFSALTAKNFKEQKPKIVAALTKLTAGKLAQDADLDGIVELLDKLESVSDDAAEVANANSALPILRDDDDATSPRRLRDETMDADPMVASREFLNGKLSPEDLKTYDEMCAKKPVMDAEETEEEKAAREKKEAEKKKADGAQDEPPPFKGKPEVGKGPVPITKPAMDAAIKLAVDAAVKQTREDQKALREAEEAVRPYVGKLAMAHDSAADVYRTALSTLGVKDVEKIDASAYPALLAALPNPNDRVKRMPAMALDAASEKSFAERFPGAASIKVL
jgi:hypothetical protein